MRKTKIAYRCGWRRLLLLLLLLLLGLVGARGKGIDGRLGCPRVFGLRSDRDCRGSVFSRGSSMPITTDSVDGDIRRRNDLRLLRGLLLLLWLLQRRVVTRRQK